MGGTVIVPWYATGFRGDAFEAALNEVAATALRYGAGSYAVYRARDDRYKFQQLAFFAEHLDWERYWNGPEMTEFRVRHSSWFQVPVLYGFWEKTAGGAVLEPALPRGDGRGDGRGGGQANGHGNGSRGGGVLSGESA
jgi:hypothetical protein